MEIKTENEEQTETETVRNGGGNLNELMRNLMVENAEKRLKAETLSQLYEDEKRNSAELRSRAESLETELASLREAQNGITEKIPQLQDLDGKQLASLRRKMNDLESDLKRNRAENDRKAETTDEDISIRSEIEAKFQNSARKTETEFNERKFSLERKIRELSEKFDSSKKQRIKAEKEVLKAEKMRQDLESAKLERDKIAFQLKNAQNVLKNGGKNPKKVLKNASSSSSSEIRPKDSTTQSDTKLTSDPQKKGVKKKVTFKDDPEILDFDEYPLNTATTTTTTTPTTFTSSAPLSSQRQEQQQQQQQQPAASEMSPKVKRRKLFSNDVEWFHMI